MKLISPAAIIAILSQMLAALVMPAPVLAATSGVLISELQTASTAHAGDEFVELYNPTAAAVDLSGWTLQYHSASSTDCTKNWSTKLTLGPGSSIVSHGFYLMSSTGYLASADANFSSGLAAAGAIRLQNPAAGTEAAIAWGSGAPCGNKTPAAAPPAGASLERRPGTDIETGGNAYNTGDDSADFLLRSTPNPQSTASPTEDPVANYTPIPGTGSITGSSSTGPAAVIELNELLPDPAAPLADAHDEFIEFFNPNDFPVNLASYVVKTGATLQTKHILPNAVITPGGYTALISGLTKIQLANSGSSVALFDPAGNQLGATVTYGKAPTGAAWALNDDAWSWTTTPTPGAANLITVLPAASASKSSTKSKSAAPAKSKSSGRTASSKAAKALKAAKATVAKAASATAPALAATTSPGGRWLLFTLAGLTIAYVIYEFRYDVRNLYFKLRGNPSLGPPAGQTPRGRRRARTSE